MSSAGEHIITVTGPTVERTCVKCGRCMEACPMDLKPKRLCSAGRGDPCFPCDVTRLDLSNL